MPRTLLNSPRPADDVHAAPPLLSLGFSPVEPARWTLLAILAISPWFYGCVQPWTWPWFTSALLAATGMWIGGLIVRGRRPGVAWPLLALVCLLLDQGWLVTLNAGYRYDRDLYEFLAVKPLFASWLPQAIDNEDAIPMMLRCTGLLGIVLLASDASQHGPWRKRLYWTLTFTGTLLTAFGLAQRTLPDVFRYWRWQDLDHTLFATYYYHGNAGAYLNLILPFAFGSAIHAFIGNRSPAHRAFGAAALFLNLAGAVATASKAAQCITLILLVALILVYRREFGLRKSQTLVDWRRMLPIIGIGLAGAIVLASASGLAVERWRFLPQLIKADNPRVLADQACLRMLPDAGWWGIGPGNFTIDFPHYTNGMSNELLGHWTYAHQDYLQTAVEWGWLGAAGWGALVFGALWHGRRWSRQPSFSYRHNAVAPSLDSILLRSAWLALLGVLLHATVDFPLQIGSIQVVALTLAGVLWGQSPRLLSVAASLSRPVGASGTKKAVLVKEPPVV